MTAALWAFAAMLWIVPVASMVVLHRTQRAPSRIEFSADFLQASGPKIVGTFIRNWPRREIEDVMPTPEG
ncbi:MAG TPA: hypothetical protein VGV35_17175, partial [Bryobacteraceae bacterium]|nr:hypothetical protein [Bryobacteraceae bacterium]